MLDYIRIACAVPEVKVGNVSKNVQDICSFLTKAEEAKAKKFDFEKETTENQEMEETK